MRIATIVFGTALTTMLALSMLAQNAPQAPPQGGAPAAPDQSSGVYLKPDKMIEELDTNKDGCISKAEWLAGGLPDSIYSVLEGQAVKRDCVTAVELTKGKAPADIDTNHDGYLSVAELRAYIAKQSASAGPSGAGGPGPGGPGAGGPGAGGPGAGGPGAGGPGAQGGPPPAGAPGAAPQAGGSRFDEINQAVGLDPDEQMKVKAILQKSEDDVNALKKEMPAWNDQAKAAIDKIWASEKAAILDVLKDDQKPKYETYFKNWTDARAQDKH